jgi:uncharacterized protein (TIGR02246 family)
LNANEKAVAAVLVKYQDALNQANADALVELDAPDGVFMPQHSPSSAGRDAVRKAYDAVFRTIQLTVKFNVAEVVEISPGWVFARTNSAGTVKVLATGAGGPEANQKLFLFHKIGGAWKIARYCFSTTNPPQA